jgi:hypothetical protein
MPAQELSRNCSRINVNNLHFWDGVAGCDGGQKTAHRTDLLVAGYEGNPGANLYAFKSLIFVAAAPTWVPH